MIVLLLPGICQAQGDGRDPRLQKRSIDERMVAYDCSEPTNVQDRALDQGTLTCREDTTIVKHSVNTTFQLLVKEQKQRIKGYRCAVQDNRNVKWCGRYSHQNTWSKMEYVNRPIPPTVENCRRMIRDQKYKMPDGRYAELAINTITHEFYTEVGKTAPGPGSITVKNNKIACEGADWKIGGETYPDMVVDHNLQIKITTEEFIWDGETMIATSDNTRLHCSSIDQDCQTTEAAYIWDGNVQYCPFAVTKTVTGLVVTDERQREVFMSTDGSLVRLIISHQEVACGRMVQATNYPELFLAEEDHALPFRRRVDPMSVSMTTYVNNRDDYLYNHLVQQINVELNAVLQHNCEEHRRTTREDYYTKYSNPGIITYGFGNGTFATSAGEVIYYHTCKQEIVRAKELTECYDALPVTLDAQASLLRKFNSSTQWFIEPLTKRLTRYASIVPCTRHFAAKYQTYSNKWLTATPTLHFAERPRPMAQPEQVLVQMESNVDFSKGGVFDERDMKAWEAYAFIGRIRDSVASQLALQVSDTYNRGTTDKTFQTPDEWLMAKYHGLLGFLTAYGQAAAILVSLTVVWRVISQLVAWFYGGCQIYKDASTCTWDIIWTFCPTMFLMKDRREDRERFRSEGWGWGEMKANFRRFIGMNDVEADTDARSEQEEEGEQLASPPVGRVKGQSRPPPAESERRERTQPRRQRRRSSVQTPTTTGQSTPHRPRSTHYPDLDDIQEAEDMEAAFYEMRLRDLEERVAASRSESLRRPPSASSAATSAPTAPPPSNNE